MAHRTGMARTLPCPTMLPDELTPRFFSDVLGAPVATVEATRVGTGQVGASFRCRLAYAAAPPAGTPMTVVAKVPSLEEQSRLTGTTLRNYEREVRFYRDLRHTVDVRAPRCFHADWDPVGGGFVLVLEDLAPAVQGDQIAGCTVAQAHLALGELAALHAPRWGDAALDELEWLSRRTPGDAAQLQALYQMMWPGFVARYEARLAADELALGERLGALLVAWIERRDGPLTVTHGDYRLDNMMFGTDAGGYPLAVVDWQTPGQGPGAADLSYFLGAGLLVDERRRNERELVALYHAELTRRGVTGWSLASCWNDYRLYAFAGVVMAVVASMIVTQTERGDDMFMAMATRHLRHALDLDSVALLT
jgi:hypothetical protein